MANRLGGDAYGPVKAGDTLSSIARSTKPGDVSLDQMLVALFSSNPDAFFGKNMNRLKTGKILRVPDASELAAINTADASKEVRLQAANWNAYREQLAAAAPTVPDETAKQVATGRITARVEDEVRAGRPRTCSGSRRRTVVAPSRRTGGGKGSRAAQERIRSLEEEITARDKELQEANERVAMLEKSVSDMQKLLEIKSAGGARCRSRQLSRRRRPNQARLPKDPSRPRSPPMRPPSRRDSG